MLKNILSFLYCLSNWINYDDKHLLIAINNKIWKSEAKWHNCQKYVLKEVIINSLVFISVYNFIKISVMNILYISSNDVFKLYYYT